MVMNMARMNHILEVAAQDMTVVAEPAIVYSRLNESLKNYSLFFPPDPGSAVAYTIGGWSPTILQV